MGKALGGYLRKLRHDRGVGLKTAAPDLKVTPSYLSKLETGLVDASPETLKRVAAYYGVDVQVLEVLLGRIPNEIASEVENDPEAAVRLLRDYFGE